MCRYRSHPAWDAWIEISTLLDGFVILDESHPAWDAWIEIIGMLSIKAYLGVASRMGCVD